MKKVYTFIALFCLFIILVACETKTLESTSKSTNTTLASENNHSSLTKPITVTTTKKTVLETIPNTKPIEVSVKGGCESVETKNGWIPVWCDEFEIDGSPKSTNWIFETGNGAGGWGNNELQYYTSRLENAKVEDGKLIITAIKESYNGYKYTSARMTTSGKFNFKYGKIEMKAKLPSTGGTWPAFWLMPQNSVYGGWPKSGEIDIMEATGNNLNGIMGTIHTGKYYWANNNQIGSGYKYLNNTASTAFHTYAIEWNEKGISWYLDDHMYYTTEGNANLKGENNLDVDPYMVWPFDQNFFVILNLAIGGNMGGNVSSAFTTDTYEVDYVRVFQKDYVTGDTETPSAPTNLKAIGTNLSSIYAGWNHSTDDKNVRGYNVYLDGKYYSFTSLNYAKIKDLDYNKEYMIGIEAIDYKGNVSPRVEKTMSTKDIPLALGKIEAEDYFVASGIQVETCSDQGGGKNVAYINSGDYLSFKLKVEEAGVYAIKYRVASQANGGSIQLLINGVSQGQPYTFGPTGGWQTWYTYTAAYVPLEEGIITLRLNMKDSDFNINYILIEKIE